MASTIAKIKEFFNNAGRSSAFTSAQLLSFGSRSAVDTAVHRLVKCGILRRLANGVFMVANAAGPVPDATEIAKIKASRFAKTIHSGQEKRYREIQNAFFCDGPRTSFMSIYGRLFFRQIAPSKQSGQFQNCKQAAQEQSNTRSADQNAIASGNELYALKKLASKLIEMMKLLLEKGVLSRAEILALESKV